MTDQFSKRSNALKELIDNGDIRVIRSDNGMLKYVYCNEVANKKLMPFLLGPKYIPSLPKLSDETKRVLLDTKYDYTGYDYCFTKAYLREFLTVENKTPNADQIERLFENAQSLLELNVSGQEVKRPGWKVC